MHTILSLVFTNMASTDFHLLQFHILFPKCSHLGILLAKYANYTIDHKYNLLILFAIENVKNLL